MSDTKQDRHCVVVRSTSPSNFLPNSLLPVSLLLMSVHLARHISIRSAILIPVAGRIHLAQHSINAALAAYGLIHSKHKLVIGTLYALELLESGLAIAMGRKRISNAT